MMNKIIFATCMFAGATTAAFACDDPACQTMLHKNANGKVVKMEGHDHGAHANHTAAKPTAQPINEATRALDAAMADMHKAMMVPYTGDPDRDFLRGMIPHHQGAVDMAKIVLQYGKDAQVKRLARDVIRAQEYEIGLMQRWLQQLDEKAKGPGADKAWLGKH